jgi:hypothetical protein
LKNMVDPMVMLKFPGQNSRVERSLGWTNIPLNPLISNP